MVTGSRFLADDGDGYRSSALAAAGIRIFARLLSLIVGRRSPTRRRASGWSTVAASSCSPATTRTTTPRSRPSCCCTSTSCGGAEIPVRMRPRTTGVSSINATRSIYYMIKVLLAILVGLLRARPDRGARRPRPRHRGAAI